MSIEHRVCCEGLCGAPASISEAYGFKNCEAVKGGSTDAFGL